MTSIKTHQTPIVIVKTGGLAAGITAAATVGIFAVTTVTAFAVNDAITDIRNKVSKFVGEPVDEKTQETPVVEHSKELVKDTARTKIKRFVAKSFLKNVFK